MSQIKKKQVRDNVIYNIYLSKDFEIYKKQNMRCTFYFVGMIIICKLRKLQTDGQTGGHVEAIKNSSPGY